MLRKDLTKPLLRLEPAFGPAFMPGNALGLQRKSAPRANGGDSSCVLCGYKAR